jgi:NADH:ubiquinone oxidoreductase subunit D/NADH:ubiquinone oxidoreductase subunit C
MSEQSSTTPPDPVLERFPNAVSKDERKGYSGYIVKPEKLLEFATDVRDRLGYDYLSSVTGVDYYPEDKLEVVYHVFKTTGGPAFLFKTQIPRDSAVLSSLVPVYKGAEFQEREIWDLYGVRFEGHPDLRRILMWEGFAGHPLRKDWREPFYEEEIKPFKSRWPEGSAFRIEDKNPFHNNVSYPAGFDPSKLTTETETLLYAGLAKGVHPDGTLKTDSVIVNLGPQHPSTHGVFRMAATLDGETIVDLKPVMGYLHRNHEKIGERNTWLGNMPYTDRLDYLSPMSNNFGYAIAVEKLTGVKPPERAEYIRVIMAELTRICNHMMFIGTLINDLGVYFTGMLYALEERELILDIFEAVTGSRMMNNYFRFGGIARDLPEGILERIKEIAFERLPRKMDEMDIYATDNEIIQERCQGVGILTPEQAIAYSITGPVLRASGVPYDVRKAEPYSIYDRFDFDIPVRYHGDTYDRYLIRMDEVRQSTRIIQQAVTKIPEGPILAGKPQYVVRVPAGESYGRVEGPKGELGFYLISNGKANPWRYHVRAPSFINLTALSTMCRGVKVADAVIILGSIDIVLGETDR